jgi:hypothetical protein
VRGLVVCAMVKETMAEGEMACGTLAGLSQGEAAWRPTRLAALGQVEAAVLRALVALLALLGGQPLGALARHAVAHAPLHAPPKRLGGAIGLAPRACALLRREHEVGVLQSGGGLSVCGRGSPKTAAYLTS